MVVEGRKRTLAPRWLFAVMLLALVGCVARPSVWHMPAAGTEGDRSKVFPVRGFILEDEKGERCAILNARKTGSILTLGPGSKLTRSKDGPTLSIFDKEGALCIVLGFEQDGPFIHLRGPVGKVVLSTP